uniref:Uncharacterized protein n=1 Tax=Arundo donax TaxID=35708 RepID=A0A0A9CRL8_ARUDO
MNCAICTYGPTGYNLRTKRCQLNGIMRPITKRTDD